MYTVTFYSFKGGVGRTMALVNTAVELAQRGRKVLIVDFDLEAPGLSTYTPFTSLHESPGIVEYVTKYIETATAPRAVDFITECNVGESSVWVMPAGKRDAFYSGRLYSIDWQSLYANYEGYLMFEDLKEQWKQQKFDYVLIDSRTGHTDIGGICTRQLPDAVVLMFFPNDQNIIGLENIVREIREEPRPKHSEKISLHFCASNVPDLDDEEHILERKLSDAENRLGTEESPIVIHHYNSLTLIEQSIFVRDRPASKLTREYLELIKEIISRNIEDRQGILEALSEFRPKLKGDAETDDLITARLKKILELHTDGEIAYAAANVYRRFGDFDSELQCLNIAIEKNFSTNTARLRRIEIVRLQDRQSNILPDLKEILDTPRLPGFEFTRAVELLHAVDKDWISTLERSPSLANLGPAARLRIADKLMTERRGARLAAGLMRQALLSIGAESKIRILLKDQLIVALIGSQQFEAAIKTFELDRSQVSKLDDIITVFNYSMAEWGRSGHPPVDLMRRIIELTKLESRSKSANFYQCIALAHAICGEESAAKQYIHTARNALKNWRGHSPLRFKGVLTIFSYWRFLEATPSQMYDDLDAEERFIEGEKVQPPVFSKEP